VPQPHTITGDLAQVDTVGIAFPVDDFDRAGCTVTVGNYAMPGETFKYSRKLDGGGFLATGVGNMGWCEASLPKRVDGENFEALQIGPAIDVLRTLYDEAASHCAVPDGHDFEESRVVRLDLVRDFHHVDNPTTILDGLASIDQPGRAKVRRFADPSANRAETLRVGPRAWGCTLYDKHVETGGRAPAGQVRFEARLHRPQLRSAFARANGGHFGCVADLIRAGNLHGTTDDGQALERASRAWFDRVGFGRDCQTDDALARRIELLELRPAIAASLWCYLTAPAIVRGWSAHTVRKYRGLAADLNLAPATNWATNVVRLDFDSGTVVERRAA
jgi:hypothetical protein